MTTYDEHSSVPHFGHTKRHRMDIMDEYLASIGYHRKPIPKDGSCLFRALSEQLFSTQAHHLVVRESCCRYMKKNQSTFENFIDGSFDEYLTKMINPKEWGDQLEISALSKMYLCDFCIYEQPGQRAKNVTENDFNKKVYLCHSGQKHYDNVYPVKYFTNFGICQSIIYSLLFEKILGFDNLESQRSITTFRMLSTPSSDDEDEETVFPSDFLYEPSIGILTPGVPPECQLGLAYKFPISIDFIRGMDPHIYRNIDYDFWITIKRAQQYIDFAVAETMPYLIGDRCMVTLSIYSKPLVGHVQEVSPDFGPITVFIEDLGGKHTVAVKNAKPMCNYNNGCRLEMGKYRRKPFQDGSGWGNNGKGKRYSYRNKHCGMASYHMGEFGFNPRYLEFVASQQKKLRGSVPAMSGNGNGRNGNSSNYKNKGKNSRKKSSLESISPTLGKNAIDHPGNYDNKDWEPGYHDEYGPPNETNQMCRIRNEEGLATQIWNLNINSVEQPTLDSGGSENQVSPDSQQNGQNIHSDVSSLNGVSTTTNYISQNSQDSIGSNKTINYQNTNPNKQPEDENNNHDVSSTPPINIQPEPNNYQQNIGYDAYGQPISQYGPSSYPPNPQPPQYYPQQSLPSYLPYTMIDNEGKEVLIADEKSPFHYFYNLGVEYYRQLSASGQRPVLINGASPQYVQPNNNTMSFIPNNQPYINTQQPNQCVPHFHPHTIPQANQFNNPRLLVQIQPNTPLVQQFQQPQYTSPQVEENSPEAPSVNMATNNTNVTPPSHIYMLQPEVPTSSLYPTPRGYHNGYNRAQYVPRIPHYPSNVYQQRFDGHRMQNCSQVLPQQNQQQQRFRA